MRVFFRSKKFHLTGPTSWSSLPGMSTSAPQSSPAKAPRRPAARERIIGAALELMLGRGYSATTVDEICEAAKASKGSFYHAFASKEDLGLAALETYYDLGLQRLLSGAFADAAEPLERLIGFLKQTEAQSMNFWAHGCLLGTFAMDLAETNSTIRQRVASLFDDLAAKLAPLFAPASELHLESSPLQLAASYLIALEGSIVMARAFNDPLRIREGLASFRRQLKLRKEGTE